MKVSQGSSGPTAAYSCNHGFILKGSATRACVNGVWQAEAPVCQGECVDDQVLLYSRRLPLNLCVKLCSATEVLYETNMILSHHKIYF